jgi:hypothetical protein
MRNYYLPEDHHCRTSPFRAIALLKTFCQILSGFHIEGRGVLKEQGRQPCLQPPTWRTLYLCSQVRGWLSYTPDTGFPFSSPSKTRNALVEIFHTEHFPKQHSPMMEILLWASDAAWATEVRRVESYCYGIINMSWYWYVVWQSFCVNVLIQQL